MLLIFRPILAPIFLTFGFLGLPLAANAAEDFAACKQFFANGNPPAVAQPRPDIQVEIGPKKPVRSGALAREQQFRGCF